MKSNYPYPPAQSSESSPRRIACSHPFEDFIGNWEHSTELKHDFEEDCNFISNEIKAGPSSSSSFDSSGSAFKNNESPRRMVPCRLFSAQTTQKNASSPPPKTNSKNPPVVPFLAGEDHHHVPSFHPIADADAATAIPIDLIRGISDHLLMDPFYWGNQYGGALDPTPFQEQGMRIPQEQDDEIDPFLLVGTFPPEDREPVSSIRRVSVIKRKYDEDGSDATEQQEESDTKEEEITSILDFSHVTPIPSKQPRIVSCPSPVKKPRLVCPSPVKSMEQSDEDAAPLIRLLSTKKKTNKNKRTKNKKTNKNKLSATKKLPLFIDGASSNKKVAIVPSFRQHHAENWMLHLAEATEYQRENGHCSIPHSYPPNQQLARWAKRQRYQYKLYKRGNKSSMTQERVQALVKLAFCWDAHKESWYARYEELKQFKMVHGNSNVPSNYGANRKLATWVKCQRRQYKLMKTGQHSNIVPDRIELLEKLDFVWDCTTKEMAKIKKNKQHEEEEGKQ